MLNNQTICTCSNRPHEGVYKRQERFDPTKTTSLRRSFVVAMRKRVKMLCTAIIKKVVEGDCFGLMEQQFKITVMSFPGHKGRPGQVGGSLPRGAIANAPEELINFRKANPNIRASLFSISEIADKIRNWDRNNYDMYPADRAKVDSLLSADFTKLHPIIIERYTKDGGWKIIDGWHRASAALRLGHPYISAMIKDRLNPPATYSGEFNFSRSADKVTAFMEWLKQQEKLGLLAIGTANQLGQGVEGSWTDFYIADSYERGVQRARRELIKRGYDAPALDKLAPVSATFSTPFHIDRVGLVFSRVYTELKGITNDMDKQISTILSQGLVDGKNPRDLAELLVRTITGPDGDLGITDTLGRYIPAARRAEMLARTEIIRAHAIAQLQEAKNWGLEEVYVEAEFVDAGFNVCPICSSYNGKTFAIAEAWNIIPVHPNCRCTWVFKEKVKK